MVDKNNPPAPQSEQASVGQHPAAELPTAQLSEQPRMEVAERLIWALLDDQISAAQCNQLERLILDHLQVRQRYLECMQLHIDLQAVHGHGARAPADSPKSPVLGSLDIGCPMTVPNVAPDGRHGT